MPGSENVIKVMPSGPLVASGEISIAGHEDRNPAADGKVGLCRCGHSSNKPFCDATHKATGFDDRGAIDGPGTQLDALRGPVVVRAMPMGPLLVRGNFALANADGEPQWRGEKAALCRCGLSQTKPFCDGTHKGSGWDAAGVAE